MAPYRRLNNAVPGGDVPWTLAEGTEKGEETPSPDSAA